MKTKAKISTAFTAPVSSNVIPTVEFASARFIKQAKKQL